MDPLQQQNQSQIFNFTGESTTSESVTHDRDGLTYFILPVLIIFVVLGLLGNIIILCAVCAVRRSNRPENLILASLSTASVVIMIATLSAYVQLERPFNFYGPLYCKSFPGIHTLMVPAKGFTMICISLERTQRVRFPLTRVTKLSSIKKIGFIWSLALLSELPRGIFYQYDPNMKTLVKCFNTKQILGTSVPFVIYVTTNYLLTYLLPSFWLARDWTRLVSQLRFLIAFQTLPSQTKYRERQKKLIGHAIIFTSIFIAVKVPCGTHALFYQLPPQLLGESVTGWAKKWGYFFFSATMLHGSFYPFIIFALSGHIRKYLLCSERNHRHQPYGPSIARIT